jgi:hypothetical protein
VVASEIILSQHIWWVSQRDCSESAGMMGESALSSTFLS